jgi:serine/threonine protein kinase
MPAPASVSEFLDFTQRSGVIDETRLNGYIQQLRTTNSMPTEPNRLAGMMVRDGLLTYFQAEQLLMGKWKRFSIGRYKVLERIGVGGMGQVYLCEHKVMKRRVAVKVLPPAKEGEESSSLDRFYREARAVAALDHPNIVRAYDLDQDDHLHFLIMEFVDGSNLQDIVKKSGPLSPLRVCHYVYQSALGLQHAFDRAGLVHRDIKPGNILVDHTGLVKILDMGLARFFHDDDDMLTKKYDETVLGTADYLAPEQALDSHSVDIRADIYSLGATMYFMLTGNPPFTEGTVTQKLIWHQQKEPKPVHEYRSDVPAEVLAILAKMMAKSPDDRFQIPSEVAEALAPFVQTPIDPPPDVEMPRLSPAATLASGGIPGPLTPTPAKVPAPPLPAPVVQRPPTPAPTPKTVISAASSIPVPAIPQVEAAPQVNSIAVPTPVDASTLWGQLASETPNPTAADTAVRRPAYKPPSASISLSPAQRAQLSGKNSSKNRRLWVIIGVVVIALTIVGIGIAIATSGGKPTPSPALVPAAPSAPTTWTVDASAPLQGVNFHRLYQAIAKAKTGDRILVRNDLREVWTIDWKQKKGISIEADGPAPVHWRLPENASTNKQILDLTEAEDVKIKGFVFDGENKVSHGIYMAFLCPGVVVEYVSFVRHVKSGVMLSNAGGDSSRPLVIRRIRTTGHAKAESGLTLFARPGFSPPQIQNVQIEGCIFEGPAGAAITLDGPTQDLQIRNNRIFRGTHGLLVKTPPAESKLSLSLQSNTWHSLQGHGVYFEGVPTSGGSIKIEQNYFAGCKNVIGVKDGKPVPGLAAKSNARNAQSAEGSLASGSIVVEHAFAVLDPNSPKQFLRYPTGSPLATASGGPIGAPPD